MANEKFPCAMLKGSLSVNLNHLKSGTVMFNDPLCAPPPQVWQMSIQIGNDVAYIPIVLSLNQIGR